MKIKRSGVKDGQNLAYLLLESPTWVHRKVESLRLGSEGTTRRRVSLDVTMPRGHVIIGGAGQVIVPLGLINKGVLENFDVSDAAGHSLPVPASDVIRDLTKKMAHSLIPAELIKTQKELNKCRLLIDAVIDTDAHDHREAIDRFLEWAETHLPIEQRTARVSLFMSIIGRLAYNFILMILVERIHVGRRTIIKYAHNTHVPLKKKNRHKTIVFRLPISDFGFAHSQHVELEVPHELAITKFVGVESLPSGGVAPTTKAKLRRPGPMAHLAFQPKSRLHQAEVFAAVRPSKQGIFALTRAASVIVFVVTAISFLGLKLHLLHALGAGAVIPSQSASVLLAGPAIFISWISLTPEHEITSKLIAPLRWILLALAFILFIFAFMAAIPLSNWAWNTAWAVLLIIQGWTSWSYLRYLADRPARQTGLLKR